MKITFSHLNDEIRQYRKQYPLLKDDAAFVLWFLRAYLDDSEEKTTRALTGQKGDKGIDAILVDERAKQVHIVQGKFRGAFGEHTENRNDVLGFADLAAYPWSDKATLESFYSKLAPIVREKFQNLVHQVRRNDYELRMYFVSTGRCSDTLKHEARQRAEQAQGKVDLFVCDGHDVRTIYADYLMGVSPAVPELTLRMTGEGLAHSKGAVRRYDPETKIDSWVFSMAASDVGQMYAKVGVRLFARNIRGFLGPSNEINKAMARTVKNEPHNFWYYNNGVTIICDSAKPDVKDGQDVLVVQRPQVINGQQTTRTLHQTSSHRASVLVKVISIPREDGDADHFDDMVMSVARGHPTFAYAKWLVLHFMWNQLGRHLSGVSERRFRRACEDWYGHSRVMGHLEKACRNVFKAALRFYRKECGVGQEAMDRQTFFKQSGLQNEFERFWNSAANSARRETNSRIRKFLKELSSVELPD